LFCYEPVFGADGSFWFDEARRRSSRLGSFSCFDMERHSQLYTKSIGTTSEANTFREDNGLGRSCLLCFIFGCGLRSKTRLGSPIDEYSFPSFALDFLLLGVFLSIRPRFGETEIRVGKRFVTVPLFDRKWIRAKYSLTVITTMSSRGRVMIPAEVRRRQNLSAGDELIIEERNNEVVLRKTRRRHKKSLLQWMRDCPVADFRFERLTETEGP